MPRGYTVYWQPGCTSCLRTREFLRERGVEFESVNVREAAGAMQELERLGIRSVPAIVRGEQYVLGQDLDEVARFVGVPLEHAPLPEAVLADRLPRLLDCAAALTRLIPDSALDTTLPGRKRTYLDLAYHVPQVVVAFLDAAAGGCLTYEHFQRKPPERLRTAADAAAAIEHVARCFARWWQAAARDLPDNVDTYYGSRPLHAVLERSTWHVAQHVRQLDELVGQLGGVTPGSRIAPELLRGLPLPSAVWEAESPVD